MKQLLGPVHIQICPDNSTSALKNGDKSYRSLTREKLCTSYAAISTLRESYQLLNDQFGITLERVETSRQESNKIK